MTEEGDRLLRLIGAGVVLFIVVAVGLLVLAAANAPPESDAPRANWSIERVNASYTRIVHEGGDPIAAEDVVVTVDGYERSVTWSGRLTEGAAGVFRAREGQMVRLYWTGGHGDRVELDSWRAP